MFTIFYQCFFCQACTLRKHNKEKTPKHNTNCMKSSFELVHIDVRGPFTTTPLSKAQYILTFINDHSRFGQVFFMKKKNDVFSLFNQLTNVGHEGHLHLCYLIVAEIGKNRPHPSYMFCVLCKQFLGRIKAQFGKSIKVLHSDKGGEYTSIKFKEFCKDQCVMQQFTQTNSHH